MGEDFREYTNPNAVQRRQSMHWLKVGRMSLANNVYAKTYKYSRSCLYSFIELIYVIVLEVYQFVRHIATH